MVTGLRATCTATQQASSLLTEVSVTGNTSGTSHSATQVRSLVMDACAPLRCMLLCDESSSSAVFRVKIFQCNGCDCAGIKKTRVGSKTVKVRTGSQMLVVQTDHKLLGSNLEAARSKGAFIGDMTFEGVPEACSLWFTGVDAGLRSVLAKVRGDLTQVIAQKKRKQCATPKGGSY